MWQNVHVSFRPRVHQAVEDIKEICVNAVSLHHLVFSRICMPVIVTDGSDNLCGLDKWPVNISAHWAHVYCQWRTQEFCSGGVQKIQLRTEDREKGGLGAVAP